MKQRGQLALGLKPRFSWGGRRSGAGRKPGAKPIVLHRSRPPLSPRFPCHVTLRVRERVPSLRLSKVVRDFERSLARASERGEFRVVHYSLQSNHAHFVVEARDRMALGRGMKSLGARLARAMNRACRRRGRVLEERYHLRIARTPLEVRRLLAYVLLNSRRHARRATRPALDPASSARWFDGFRSRPGGTKTGPPAVAPPRTWLLRRGWRRHGLIDPEEVPG
jgi:putative transposase